MGDVVNLAGRTRGRHDAAPPDNRKVVAAVAAAGLVPDEVVTTVQFYAPNDVVFDLAHEPVMLLRVRVTTTRTVSPAGEDSGRRVLVEGWVAPMRVPHANLNAAVVGEPRWAVLPSELGMPLLRGVAGFFR